MKKTVLITGAATGIGLAVTKLLSKNGWYIFATAMPGQNTQDLLKYVPAKNIIHVDLSNHISIKDLIEKVKSEGTLDALVSNAGIAVPGPIEEVSPDDLRLQFAVNTFAPAQLAQGLLPLLRASKGHMIFVGAGQGRVALPFGGPYGASKAALAALTDALRTEVAKTGVMVSLIEPGAVKTNILQSSQVRSAALLQKMSPEARTLYKEPLEKVLNQSEVAFKTAMPPEAMAELIEKILSTKSPKPRYLVGREAKALAFIALLPAKLRASLVRKTIS